MNRKEFSAGLAGFHGFVEECRKAAIDIVSRHGGSVNLEEPMHKLSYFFIGLAAHYVFVRAYVAKHPETDKDLIKFELLGSGPYTGTAHMDFEEATWDTILLSDVMHALFDIDGQGDD